MLAVVHDPSDELNEYIGDPQLGDVFEGSAAVFRGGGWRAVGGNGGVIEAMYTFAKEEQVIFKEEGDGFWENIVNIMGSSSHLCGSDIVSSQCTTSILCGSDIVSSRRVVYCKMFGLYNNRFGFSNFCRRRSFVQFEIIFSIRAI